MRINFLTPLVVLIGSPILGLVLGAATNFVNGTVSREYFGIVMFYGFTPTLERVVQQGMSEGTGLGLLVGIVAAIAISVSTGFRCPVGLACKTLVLCAVVTMVCWMLGGLFASISELILPSIYESFFPITTRASSPVRFAWVGGTIWGAYGGTFASVIVGPIWLYSQWKRLVEGARGFPIESKPASQPSDTVPSEVEDEPSYRLVE